MLLEYTLFDIIDKVRIAIERMQEFEPEEGYYLAFSGGKDSLVIKELADMAGVKYDAHFSLTSVDPREVLTYCREYHPDVSMEKPDESMWKLIVRKRMPPTRRVRYCCEALKERGGAGRLVMTGVRWEESHMRKKRKMVEICFKNSNKRFLHPIIEWKEIDVWEFIRKNKLQYCSLYDEGFKRIGCVLCPMYRGRKADVERFPGFYKAYLRAFDKMLEARRERNLHEKISTWVDAQGVMDWWLSENKDSRVDGDQILFSMFE